MKSIRSSSTARQSRPCVEELEVRQLLTGIQPSALEQLLLERLNDIRANPAAYGAQIGVDLSNVAPMQALAWNTVLVQTARGHSLDMNDRAYYNSTTPEGVDLNQRLANAGLTFTSVGESL